MAKFLNIEVGDSFVKVCLTEKKKNIVILKKAFMVETPIGTAADGMISDPGMLGSALTPKLHEHGMSGVKNVIFTLVSGKVATREVMLPPVKENRIKQVIEANTSDYFPVDISRYLVSYGMLKTVSDGREAGSHLMALAAPLQLLDGYIKLAEKMNLEIQGIDYGGNSQFQVLKTLGGANKVTMCIAVTGNHTCITIAKGDRLILQRMLPWGGDDLVDAYLSAKGEDNGDHEKALDECSIPLVKFLAKGILEEQEINRAYNRIVGGISRSMDFFNSSRWSAPLDNIILAGTCANLAGLREAVSGALGGAEVFPLEEFASAALGTVMQGDRAMISHYITAYGSTFAPVDLIPDKYKATKERKKNSEHGIIGAVVIFATSVIASAILSFSAIYEESRLRKELDEVMQEVNSTRYVEAEHSRYVTYRNAERGFAALDEATRNNNSGLADFFEELEEKMPSDILLLSAVCTNEGVIMNIRVPALETAAMVINQFHTFESVEHLEISSLTQGLDEAGFFFYSFTVNCLYEKPIPPEKPAERVSSAATDESEVD
ncbi:MAG: pilus assembly protein PilM [Oscillospiraceae bacterium]|nr:pilus assembly protein PilM [Oscillospiraceae bacterium]